MSTIPLSFAVQGCRSWTIFEDKQQLLDFMVESISTASWQQQPQKNCFKREKVSESLKIYSPSLTNCPWFVCRLQSLRSKRAQSSKFPYLRHLQIVNQQIIFPLLEKRGLEHLHTTVSDCNLWLRFSLISKGFTIDTKWQFAITRRIYIWTPNYTKLQSAITRSYTRKPNCSLQ